jgi:DNA polymerase-3 subunit epsilon
LADVFINLTRGQDALLMDDSATADQTGHAFAALDLSRFKLTVLLANEQEVAAHEDVLQQIDKSSASKTVWRKWLVGAQSAV